LQPNEEQKILLSKHFGSTRFIFNYFLNQRKDEYLNNKKSITYNKQAAFLTQLKKEDKTVWLKEINAQTLQYALKCLDQSYQNFFNKKSKFPKFKSKRDKNTFTVPQSVKISKNELIIPKFNAGIKMICERKVEGLIKKCSITKTPTGKYFVSILVEREYISAQKTNKKVGIDLGIKDFLITSDGLKIKNHRFVKKYEKNLVQSQKSLSRKEKGSVSYKKQRLKVGKIYEKISNSRNDLLHKTTKMLIDNYDEIYLEDLNVKGLSSRCKPKQDENGRYLPNGQSAKSALNKAILDVSWSKFVEILSYKAEWNDKKIIKINRFFPSSKTCNCCGYINHNLTLNDRNWVCPSCNTLIDRDLNAAKNILDEGLRLNTSVGTTDYGCGDEIRLNLLSTVCEALKEIETF
jgi:putative transposase